MKSKRMFLATTVSVAFLAAACAAKKPAGDAAAAPAEKAAPAKQQANAPHPAPAGSKLAQIQRGMSDSEVRRILGEPDSNKTYETGKRWIPGYSLAGLDQSRTEYIYHGVGRITLTRNEYSGSLKVLRVDYDPSL